MDNQANYPTYQATTTEGYTDPRYKPLSPWAYVGYNLLFSLPIAGLVLLIVFSISDSNLNRRSYARSHWCALLIVAIIALVIAIIYVIFFVVLGVGLGALDMNFR